MNVYLVKFQYQGDDRVEDEYLVYSNTTDEFEVEAKVAMLDSFDELESACIYNWADEDEEEEDQYVKCVACNITDEYLEYKDSSWFKSLEVLIDERA